MSIVPMGSSRVRICRVPPTPQCEKAPSLDTGLVGSAGTFSLSDRRRDPDLEQVGTARWPSLSTPSFLCFASVVVAAGLAIGAGQIAWAEPVASPRQGIRSDVRVTDVQTREQTIFDGKRDGREVAHFAQEIHDRVNGWWDSDVSVIFAGIIRVLESDAKIDDIVALAKHVNGGTNATWQAAADFIAAGLYADKSKEYILKFANDVSSKVGGTWKSTGVAVAGGLIADMSADETAKFTNYVNANIGWVSYEHVAPVIAGGMKMKWSPELTLQYAKTIHPAIGGDWDTTPTVIVGGMFSKTPAADVIKFANHVSKNLCSWGCSYRDTSQIIYGGLISETTKEDTNAFAARVKKKSGLSWQYVAPIIQDGLIGKPKGVKGAELLEWADKVAAYTKEVWPHISCDSLNAGRIIGAGIIGKKTPLYTLTFANKLSEMLSPGSYEVEADIASAYLIARDADEAAREIFIELFME